MPNSISYVVSVFCVGEVVKLAAIDVGIKRKNSKCGGHVDAVGSGKTAIERVPK